MKMSGLLQDLRYALRQLRKTPGFTAVAMITLALGIGANAAIFSVLNAVLLRPLPYAAPSRLVWLTNYLPRGKDHIVATPDFVAWRNQNDSFTGLAAYDDGDLNLTGGGASPERIHCASVTASFFSVLGVQPEVGRAFRKDENTPGVSPVVILSHGFWQRRFAADRSVIGNKVVLDGSSAEVVGVMPASFVFPDGGAAPEVFLPLSLPEHLDMASQRIEIVRVIGRLRPDVTIDEAKAEVSTIQQRLVATYPPAFKNMVAGMETQVTSLQERLVGNVRPTLLMLLAAVVFLLLVACANTANLQLAKATAQSKELGVRAALGASRFRLTCQLLIESLLVSLFGGAGGVLFASWSIEILNQLHTQGLPQFNKVNLDYRVLAFASVVAVVSGALSGLAPAVLTWKCNLNDTLKEGSRTLTDTQSVRRVRKLLLVSEIAIATILLVGSGLFIRSFVGLLRVESGFDPHKLLTLQISLPEAKYPTATQQRAFFDTVLDKVGALPDVAHVGAVTTLPLVGHASTASVIFEGRPTPPPGLRPWVNTSTTSADYFRTMGVPLVRGRYFDSSDTPSGPGVVLVNQAFCRRFFDSDDPVGKRIQRGTQKGWITTTIVGVVGDVRSLGPQIPPSAEIFTDVEQDPHLEMAMVLRASVDPLTLVPAVRQAVLSLDQEQPTFNVATMDQRLADSIASQQFNMWLLAAFGVVALWLAAIGLYGVISFYIVQRTHEIGIRMALGATRRHVLRLVLGQGAVLVFAGIVIGVAAALALTRFLSSMLFGVRPNDVVTFVAVAIVLAGAACMASYVPARRATKVDPMVALRYE
jgi:predicted permease